VGTLVRGSAATRAGAGIAHAAAATLAGALTGLAVGSVGGLLPLEWPDRLLVLALVTVSYGAMELGLVRLPLPQSGRQVPAQWRYRYPPMVTAALYGALLGPGVGTRVADAGYVVILAGAALLGDAVTGTAILGTYGAARGLSAVILANAGPEGSPGPVLWGLDRGPVWRALSTALTFAVLGAAVAATVEAMA
nr:hypothetical protein [Actinomycetota bacterium]